MEELIFALTIVFATFLSVAIVETLVQHTPTWAWPFVILLGAAAAYVVVWAAGKIMENRL